MIHIRVTIARFIASLKLRVASFLDREVDGLVNQFLKIDAKLEAYIERRKAQTESLGNSYLASVDRELVVASAEASHRARLIEQQTAVSARQDRARRIKGRMAALLD